MNRYLISHVHEYGTSIYRVDCDFNLLTHEIDEIIQILSIDYEEDKGEFIDIDNFEGHIIHFLIEGEGGRLEIKEN